MMLTWLPFTLSALVLYGLGQGLVKKYISEVPPARFCLYFVVAKAILNLSFFFTQEHPDPFAAEGREFLLLGIFAYILDGAAWVLYFESIQAGPITIVGTLSAAYPVMTVLFAWLFLGEQLIPAQYLGILAVILGCAGLSYAPPDPSAKMTKTRWIPLAATALVLWGISGTLAKYTYSLPQANEGNLLLFNTIGGFLTLGLYGWLRGRSAPHKAKEWGKSLFPMGMMAGGDLCVILALRTGPASLVTPMSGAYPLVTLAFASAVLKEKITNLQWVCIFLILLGMVLSPGNEGLLQFLETK